MPVRVSRLPRLLAVFLIAPLAGCSYGGSGPPAPHYLQFNAEAPRGNTVSVCSAYGCRHKSKFTFTHGDIATLKGLMQTKDDGDSPAAERRAVRKAIAWIENRVGRETGTWKDRSSIDLAAAGDPTQMDCVDEATNTSSYLTVLAAHGLLRHHEVVRPMAKDGIFAWTHYFAVMREKASGVRWAVDSSMYANGREPIVVEADKWYVNTAVSLPPAQ